MTSAAAARELETRVLPWTDWIEVEPVWRDLFRQSPYRSFFVSPEWVRTWLSVFGPQLDPEILIFSEEGRPAGCCLLVYRDTRAGFVPIRSVHLNTAGEDEADETYVEFNDLLVLAGREHQVARALRAHLATRSWDQFALDGCVRSAAIEALLEAFAGLPVNERTDRSFYVPLGELHASGTPFERTLSKNTRHNLRRSAKTYEQFGELRIEEAHDTATALVMLDELARLHQQRWQDRNEKGVFQSALFTEFNRELVRNLHRQGTVQLLRVSAGTEAIGVVSNVILEGKVYFYLCGFRYGEDTNLRPGLITVHRAIEHCLQQGYREFDLMAGDVQYKRSFSEQFRMLSWLVLERPSAKLRMVAALRSAKQTAKKMSPAVRQTVRRALSRKADQDS